MGTCDVTEIVLSTEVSTQDVVRRKGAEDPGGIHGMLSWCAPPGVVYPMGAAIINGNTGHRGAAHFVLALLCIGVYTSCPVRTLDGETQCASCVGRCLGSIRGGQGTHRFKWPDLS